MLRSSSFSHCWKTSRLLQALLECLQQGLPVPGNVCEFWSLDAFEHVQELWRSFGCDAPLTVLLTGDAIHTKGALLTRISVTRGRWGSENAALLPLGNRKSPTIQAATKLMPLKSLREKLRVTVKVTAPTCYRTPFRQDPDHADTPAEVIGALTSVSQVRVSDLLGGNWAVHDKGNTDKEALTGFLRLKPDVCFKLLQVSGKLGIFITKLRKPQESGPNLDSIGPWL